NPSTPIYTPFPYTTLFRSDVGSGKTIVALIAMLIAIDNGYQAAFMAPTEILAEQHFRTLSVFLKDIPLTIRLLIGGQRSKLRQEDRKSTRLNSSHDQISYA